MANDDTPTRYTAAEIALRALTYTTYPEGQCLNYYWNLSDAPRSAGTNDANEAWVATTQKVTDGSNPPAGAPVYFRGGLHGHWGPSLGNGWMRSTDWPRKGEVGNVEIWRIARVWGIEYVGWGRTYATHPIPGLEAPPNQGDAMNRTDITAQMLLDAFDKWGVKYALPYSDWATHNRNAVGDWGPLIGFMVHNFASNVADRSSEDYLYRGDLQRKPQPLPGPLSQLSLRDDGVVGCIGWGRANHGGMGEARIAAAVRLDAMPLTSEYVPTSGGTVDMNSRFIAVEMLYGGNSATAAQRAALPLLGAAIMDMLGAGYTGGSVAAHRESTNQRSDPEGFSMATVRQQINAHLKAGPNGTPTVGDDDIMAMTPKDRAQLVSEIAAAVWNTQVPHPTQTGKTWTAKTALWSANVYAVQGSRLVSAEAVAAAVIARLPADSSPGADEIAKAVVAAIEAAPKTTALSEK